MLDLGASFYLAPSDRIRPDRSAGGCLFTREKHMISLNSIENIGDGNRMATSVNADLPSELITRIRYQETCARKGLFLFSEYLERF
jgi:hypothetical protein